MIYLQGHKFIQSVYVPRSFPKRGETYVLNLRSTIGLTDTAIEVEEVGTGADNYLFNLHLPEGFPTGEYTYEVTEDGRKVAEGLAVVQHVEEEIETYKNDIEYEQYRG